MTTSGGGGPRRELWLGEPRPLGAIWDGAGTNFALYSEGAFAVELCLFDDDGRETRIEIPEHTANTHHVYLPDVGPGQRYGYRAHGPWDPGQGLRFNPAKLLVDPYARAIEGSVDWSGPVFGHDPADPSRPCHDDSAPWRHELRWVDGIIEKVSLGAGAGGEDVVVRRFESVPP